MTSLTLKSIIQLVNDYGILKFGARHRVFTFLSQYPCPCLSRRLPSLIPFLSRHPGIDIIRLVHERNP